VNYALVQIFYSSLAMITAANVVIAVVLHRVSQVSLDWGSTEDSNKRDSDSHPLKHQVSSPSISTRPSAISTTATTDVVLASKRRVSAQVTRMLLAVTLSLIICNIPNTLFFVFVKIYDTRQLLHKRQCKDVSDNDINLYKFGFYSSVIQDILSDLPHIFNFFLYCLAGKKFRSIFLNEARHFLFDLHLIKRKERRSAQGTFTLNHESTGTLGFKSNQGRLSSFIPLPSRRKTVETSNNGKTTETLITDPRKTSLRDSNPRSSTDRKFTRCYSTTE
jgi:hypothetical protein